MPRVSELTPETVKDPEAAEILRRTVEDYGTVSNFFKVMAHAPAAMKAWQTANTGVRMKYLDQDLEFLKIEQMVIMKTAMVNRRAGTYCLGHNSELSMEIGISKEQIEAIREDYESSPLLTARQKVAVRWAENVTRMEAHGDDELFSQVRLHFSEDQIVELTVLSCMWNFSNRFCDALKIELEPEGKRLSFVRRKQPAKQSQ